MEPHEATSKSFTNQQKVFVCRVVLLGPIVCILSAFLVLLVCMEFAGQSGTLSDDTICQTLNCTVLYKNGSLIASCIKDEVGNSTKMTNCLEFKVLCALGSADSQSINRSKDQKSYDNSSWKDFGFCLHNVTKLRFLRDSLLQNGANFVRELFAKEGAFINCSFDKAKAGTTPCSVNNDKEMPKQKRMRENTRTADTVLVVLLSLGLLAFIVMCVYTRKTLKFCCHMCYEDDHD